MRHTRIAIGGVAALALFVPASVAAGDGALVIAQAYAHNLSMSSYTFQMNAEMRMHHFPWLRFRIQGVGSFTRDGRYVVHFTQVPWFAARQKDLDLSLIDPEMWPSRYTYQVTGTKGEAVVFTLHALKDPTLKQAIATVNPITGTTLVLASYTDGTQITMHVACSEADGYLVPNHIDADIDAPAMPLSASAAFTDYAFQTASP